MFNHSPRVTADALDRFHTAARDAVLASAFRGDVPKQIFDLRSQDFIDWKPTAGGREYGLQSPLRLAEECLMVAGIPADQVRRLAPADLARIVMGKPLRDFGIHAASDGPAYNLTGMFSNIFYDASNVILRRGYTEAKTTFQTWMRQGESVDNFKPVHKVIAGELPDPRAIPEDGEFEETTFPDGRESYRLTVWGEMFSCSWQSVLGNSMSVFTDIPLKQSRAMRRKQNKLAYGTLKDNAALSDGVALFHSSHGNLTTGVNPPTVANFNTMEKKMMEQSGLTSGSALNIFPRFVLGPPALSGSIDEVVGSVSNPSSSNSGVKNRWNGRLEPVYDAELGLNAGGSDVAYYMAADPVDVDTVEYAYLKGLETPALDQEYAFDRLAVRWRIYQAFAVKALDFRGLQQQRGS